MEKIPKINKHEILPPITNRSFEAYLRDLHLVEQDLDGKMILDIGAGGRGFAKGAGKEGVDASIVSLDPHYANMGVYESIIMKESNPQVDSLTVAGKGESLPFADNSFDLIIANYSMPLYTQSKLQIKEYFEELKRVVKPGGEIRIFPASAMGLADLFVKWEKFKLKFESDFSTELKDDLLIIQKLDLVKNL